MVKFSPTIWAYKNVVRRTKLCKMANVWISLVHTEAILVQMEQLAAAKIIKHGEKTVRMKIVTTVYCHLSADVMRVQRNLAITVVV